MKRKTKTPVRITVKMVEHVSFKAVTENASVPHSIKVGVLLNSTLSTLGKIFSRQHFEIFFLFHLENRI